MAIKQAQKTKSKNARETSVAAGLDDLSLWLDDLIRRGLATAQTESRDNWEAIAARMVDAKAPGVANLLREIAALPITAPDWAEQVLTRLGRLQLLVQGYRHLTDLPAATQADIRTRIGWTQQRAALLKQAGQRDWWLVLGRRVTRENRLKAQVTWLWGESSHQAAYILDYAHGNNPLDGSLTPGTCLEAELVFYPGSAPNRALLKAQHSSPKPLDHLPGHPTMEAGLQEFAAALAQNPWLTRFPLAIRAVQSLRREDIWFLRDTADHILPLAAPGEQGWRLLALGGGQPLSIFGEWDGEQLTPLSAWADERFVEIKYLV